MIRASLMTLVPGAQLGPYAIVSQLGAGGMGVVYLAQDPRLDRQVAIKVLPPDLTRDATAKQRFLQEAKAASALDHPNICNIHEINETDDGQLYLVMAHYEGETLKERIGRGPLPLDEAIGIATQVGQGLAKAHAAGIVHRDIKPANLMVTADGTVKILDFGLAKLAGSEGVTQTGTTVGTVAYMSPEQARGEEVDHRTDIWSLGVVLYEMLTGQQPFRGENLLAISKAILEQEAPTLSGTASALNGVVGRALTRSPTTRYQIVKELLEALRSVSSPTKEASAASEVPSIAVLPFANMSADPEQEYFCEGMAEEIINALTTVDGLHVASRTSAFLAKEKRFDIAEIGARLKVGAVLEGSVRKAGTRLRVTAQLINVGDGFHLWSERYDREMDDVFAVQDEIARAVVEKLKVQLLGEGRGPIVKKPTTNRDAYQQNLMGRYHFLRVTHESLDRALSCFTEALQVDPNYAEAHVGVGMVHMARGTLSLAAPHTVTPVAKQAALRALALDESLADAHALLGGILFNYEWRRRDAETTLCRSLALKPDNAFARWIYTFLLAIEGRSDASIEHARHVVEHDPIAPLSHFHLAQALELGGRPAEAIAAAETGLELEPRMWSLHLARGRGVSQVGSIEHAIEAFRRANECARGAPSPAAWLGWALGVAGERDEAVAIRDALERRRAGEYISGCALATVSLGLGEHDRAIAWLETAAEERDGLLPSINRRSAFDPIRAAPRFKALLRRMNFPETAATS